VAGEDDRLLALGCDCFGLSRAELIAVVLEWGVVFEARLVLLAGLGDCEGEREELLEGEEGWLAVGIEWCHVPTLLISSSQMFVSS